MAGIFFGYTLPASQIPFFLRRFTRRRRRRRRFRFLLAFFFCFVLSKKLLLLLFIYPANNLEPESPITFNDDDTTCLSFPLLIYYQRESIESGVA